MNRVRSILRYEYKMLMHRIAGWCVLFIATVIALLDNFPSAANFARLEFLAEPAYFVYRTMSQDGLILAFGLIFLLSGRFPVDIKTGVKSLILSAPVSKGQYVLGKLLAALLYTLTMIILFLALNTTVYALFSPEKADAMEYISPMVKAVLISGIPAGFFISLCAVALPAIIDIRLFYLLISVLFIVNAGTVGSADGMPPYMITSGELIKLVWRHPKYPYYDSASVAANLLFLFGCGLASAILLMVKRKFWRAR